LSTRDRAFLEYLETGARGGELHFLCEVFKLSVALPVTEAVEDFTLAAVRVRVAKEVLRGKQLGGDTSVPQYAGLKQECTRSF
jgi:hypothetical protein